jgi:hypothetical protein
MWLIGKQIRMQDAVMKNDRTAQRATPSARPYPASFHF